MDKLSHIDNEDRAAMVDVSDKKPVKRIARAEGRIRLAPRTIDLIRENGIRKGNVLTVAEIAGIQAAKRTAGLIPLCHLLPLDHVRVCITLEEAHARAESEAVCTGRTGVEMEALTAVSVALLTIYDMCKAVDKNMHIEGIHLISKRKEKE